MYMLQSTKGKTRGTENNACGYWVSECEDGSDCRETQGIKIFYIFSVAVAIQLYTSIKTYQIAHFKIMSFM